MKLTRLHLFLIFIIFGALITGASSGVHLYFLKKEIKSEFLKDSKSVILSKEREYNRLKERIIDTLLIISYSESLLHYLQDPTARSRQDVQQTFFDLISVMPDIMQVRYLDDAGNELIKFTREHPYGAIKNVPEDLLQNKYDRPYFKAIKALQPGDVYISDFDLNVEHGTIELPVKPTIRFGTRVTDESGSRGIVIINMFMQEFIDSLKNVQLVTLYLADADGNFLVHSDATKEWAHLLGRSATIQQEFGIACEHDVVSKAAGDHGDIYSIDIAPLYNENRVKMIAQMNHSVLQLQEQEVYKSTLLQTLIIALFAFAISIIFGRYISALNEQLFLNTKLLASVGDGIFVHDTKGKMIYVNRNACTEHGYSEEEMMQLSIPELDAPEHRENIRNVIDELKARGHIRFRVEHLHKDGSRIPLDVNTSVFTYQGSPTIVSVTRNISDQLEIEHKLRESEERYRELVQTAVAGIFQTTLHGELLFANPAMKKILGFDIDADLTHMNIARFYKNIEDRRKLLHDLRSACTITNYEFDIYDNHGNERNILLNVSLSGKTITGMFLDVTETKQAYKQVATLSKVIAQIDDSVALTDVEGVINYVNDSFARHTGYSQEELIGNTQRILKSGQHPPEFYETLWKTILNGRNFRATFINKKKDDSIFYEEKTITPLKDENDVVTGFVSTAKDITDRVQMEELLRKAAQTDHLTGLFNRVKFEEALNRELEMKKRYGRTFSLIMFDIDHFKRVNDTYGHDAGDITLKQTASLLQARMRKTDIVARWGGEEFIILLPETPIETSEIIAEDIRKEIEHFEFETVGSITVSLGVTELTDDDTHDTVIKRADEALYGAKAAGRNRTVVS